MKIDPIIEKRFTELENKIGDINRTKIPSGSGFDINDELFYQWATSVLNLLQRGLGEKGSHYVNFLEKYQEYNGYYYQFEKCVGIFRAAKEDYESGYLFTVRGLIKAEDSIEVLEQALELLKNGYKDLACVLAGVSLEIGLKELCIRNSIPYAKVEIMNQELCKKSVYNLGMQKQVTAWAHWRNKAAHGEWAEYKEADVEDMIKGVTRFIGDYV